MKSTPHISIVSPVYGCRNSLTELHRRLVSTIREITRSYEIILVNDSSPDDAWDTIKEIAAKDKSVRAINLSRNFGQHYATTAGLDYARGDWVVVMDCDLQDQPEGIKSMYEAAREGYDVVLARRVNRTDRWMKKTASTLFNRVFNYLSDIKRDPDSAFFVLMRREVRDALCQFRESSRFMPSLLDWAGFKLLYHDIPHGDRADGKSGYTFKKLMKLAGNAIISHSSRPLKLIINLGVVITMLSFAYIAYILYAFAFQGISMAGWPSMIVSIWFLSGIVIITLGVIGIYIGKIFDEVKGRPLYIIKEKTFRD